MAGLEHRKKYVCVSPFTDKGVSWTAQELEDKINDLDRKGFAYLFTSVCNIMVFKKKERAPRHAP